MRDMIGQALMITAVVVGIVAIALLSPHHCYKDLTLGGVVMAQCR